MSELKELTEFLITISKIVNEINSVHEAFKATREGRRRWWVRPVNLTRDEEGFFKTCMQQLKEKDEEHFYKATRMSVANFNLLLTLLREKLQKFSNRKAIDPEARLAITLFYLAQGCNIEVLAWAHKLGISTVRKIIYETCEAIWDELHCIYLSPPNVHECKTISDKFFVKTGMPNCIGAIDGKHINIVRPVNSGSLFYNYKKNFSIVLLAACDANYVFTYVDVGALGSQSDGGILARSAFGQQILNETLNIPQNNNLPGTSTLFPYYFVGDNAFPLKNNIMRPYPGQNLPESKDNFNCTLSKARVHIENAFGIFAKRWQIFLTTIPAFPKNADKLVLAAIVLHNFLMLKQDRNYFTNDLVDHSVDNEDIEGTWRQDITPLRSYRPSSSNRSSNHAFHLRDCLKDYLQNNN